MAELLRKAGFKESIVNNILRKWANHRELKERIKELKSRPNISQEQLFQELVSNRGAGKPHCSEDTDSGEPKQSGKSGKKVRLHPHGFRAK